MATDTVRSAPRALLVIAHPDDEAMFFGPTITAHSRRYEWHVLCLSTGNADGLGEIRRAELAAACKQLQVHLHRIHDDSRLQDGMDVAWDENAVSEYVSKSVEELLPELVLTFDSGGVSGHLNHTATFRGVLMWHVGAAQDQKPTLALLGWIDTVGELRKELIEAYSLDFEAILAQHTYPFRLAKKTLPLPLKFVGPAAAIAVVGLRWCGLLQAEPDLLQPAVVSGWAAVWRIHAAMAAHVSQFVWYRRLFLWFSQYTYINYLVVVDMEKSRKLQ